MSTLTKKIAVAALASTLALTGTASANAKTPGKAHVCGKTHVAKKVVGKKGAAKQAAKAALPCVTPKPKKSA